MFKSLTGQTSRAVPVLRETLMCDTRPSTPREAKAAKRFFERMLKKHKGEPRKIVTYKWRSYGVTHRELSGAPSSGFDPGYVEYANNRVELSHQPTRVRERGMCWSDISEYKSEKQAQRFLNAHAAVYNLFNLERHLVSADTYRHFRLRSFESWKNAAMVWVNIRQPPMS